MRRLSRFFAALLLVLLPAMLSACATSGALDHLTQHDSLARASVQVATVVVLEQHAGWAPRIYAIASTTAAALDAADISTLAVVERQVRMQIHWETLSASERFVVDTLITTVRAEIEQVFARKGLTEPAAIRLYAAQVMRWIAQAAWVRCDTCVSDGL